MGYRRSRRLGIAIWLILGTLLVNAEDNAAWAGTAGSRQRSPVVQSLQADLQFLVRSQIDRPSKAPKRVPFDRAEPSELKWAALGLIRVYQKFISSQDLPACNFTPTCSQFGMEAIQRFGMMRGALLIADRLIRDNGVGLARYYPRDPDTGRFSDPVERYGPPEARPNAKAEKPLADTWEDEKTGRSATPLAPPDSSTVYDTPENLLRFADSLYAEGDYLRAAGEYQRYLFHRPNAPFSVLRRIARCYALGGQPERALQFLNDQRRVARTEALRSQLRYALAEMYFLSGDANASLALLEGSPPQGDREAFQQLIGLNYLKQRRWAAAYDLFDALVREATTPQQVEQARLYRQYALEGMRLPRKRPWLAGALSALVPGAGRLYLGRVNDVLMTLFVLGITGWQAYDGFSEGGPSSPKGWIYGTLAGIFYLGNIYGSVIGAKLQNRDAEAALLLNIPLPE